MAAGGKIGENHGTSPLQTYPRHICPIQEINLRRSVIFHEQLLMYWVARQSLSLSTADCREKRGLRWSLIRNTDVNFESQRGKVSWSHFGQSAQNMSLTMSSIIVKFYVYLKWTFSMHIPRMVPNTWTVLKNSNNINNTHTT